MEETYERQLADIVAAMPDRPCAIALVPTIPLDHAAGLASDLAQSAGSTRPGHTILTSLEKAPAQLDHEIGVEGGQGLTQVLSKLADMRQVAAQGTARRFIYVPAGAAPAPGASLVRSSAWGALISSAVRKSGTILAFVPPDDLLGAARGLRPGNESNPAVFDGIAWLGPREDASAEVQTAAIAIAPFEIGSLRLPGSSRDPEMDEAVDTVAAEAETLGRAANKFQRRSRHRIVTGPGTAGRGRAARGGSTARSGLVLLLLMIGLLGAALVYFVAVAPQPEGRRMEMASPTEPR